MIDLAEVTHHIQKHILSTLYRQRYARFRDMRPSKVETNLYSYHLKLLIKQGLVDKAERGYTLSAQGLLYVDRVSSSSFSVRTQPKVITMLVVQNSDGDVLLQRRAKQPLIDLWTLPHGKLHITDWSIQQAAEREAWDKLTINLQPTHAGDCYIRIIDKDGEIMSTTLAHVFYAEADNIELDSQLQWARPHKLDQYDLAPAVMQIVTRAFFRDPHFFEEYCVELSS